MAKFGINDILNAKTKAAGHRAIREDAEKRRISVTNRQRGYAACILARRGNYKAARRQKY